MKTYTCRQYIAVVIMLVGPRVSSYNDGRLIDGVVNSHQWRPWPPVCMHGRVRYIYTGMHGKKRLGKVIRRKITWEKGSFKWLWRSYYSNQGGRHCVTRSKIHILSIRQRKCTGMGSNLKQFSLQYCKSSYLLRSMIWHRFDF